MQRIGYIYSISHPITNQVVYIGQTLDFNARTSKHWHSQGNKFLKKWIDDLKNEYRIPVFKIISECKEADLLEKEIFYINEFSQMGVKLFNYVKKNNDNIINKVGRPPEHKAPEDTAKGHMISLTPNEDKQLIAIYGGRTEAVKQLLRPEIIKAYLDLK